MSTPRELLGILDDFAQKVAEQQLDRHEAITDIRKVIRKYPDVDDRWTEDRAEAELDRRVKRYLGRRNKSDAAAIARRLADLGMAQPDFDGNVNHDWFSAAGAAENSTLADDADYVHTNLASAWRLVKSFEFREEELELLFAAADSNPAVTRAQAIETLNRMPEARQQALQAAVRVKLSAQRRAALNRRYGAGGQAAEG